METQFSLFCNFTPHMVVQREKTVIFSGRGAPGRRFSARFAEQDADGEIGADGVWRAEFPPVPAGGPYTFTARCGETVLKLDDILCGEVWFCSGQSNMEMPMFSDNPFWRTLNAEEELAHADYPQIRLYNACNGKAIAETPRENDRNPKGWEVCDGESVKEFSACAYFFARQLHQDLGIPVGVINCSWGGTDIEAWISAEGYRRAGYEFPNREDLTRTAAEQWQAYFATDDAGPLLAWLRDFDACGQAPEEWLRPDYADGDWPEADGADGNIPAPGRRVYRLHFDLPADWVTRAETLELGYVNDTDRTFCNGKEIGATGVTAPIYWTVRRVYRIEAGVLRPGANCVAVIADNHFNSGWLDAAGFGVRCGKDFLPLKPAIRYRDVFTLPAGFPVRPALPPIDTRYISDSPNCPSVLFNGMAAAWTRFPLRGVLWYQGCNNNGQYEYYFYNRLLIDDWRRLWHDAEMPFIQVQLAAYHAHQPDNRGDEAAVLALTPPEFAPFAVIREIQAEMPHIRKNVGMVTAFDRGDAFDIHPRDKQTPGRRLARKAEKMLGWGKSADSPEFSGFRKEKSAIRVFFANAENGLCTTDGQAPLGFYICGGDGRYYAARAEIDGNSVLVRSPLVPNPQRVRYAFTGFCRVNLVNREGEPALPFRTDKPDYQAMFPEA